MTIYKTERDKDRLKFEKKVASKILFNGFSVPVITKGEKHTQEHGSFDLLHDHSTNDEYWWPELQNVWFGYKAGINEGRSEVIKEKRVYRKQPINE